MNVGIVGGGPVGLYIAICLAKRGHHITIIESKSNDDIDIDSIYPLDITSHGMKALNYIQITNYLEEYFVNPLEGYSNGFNSLNRCNFNGLLGTNIDLIDGLISYIDSHKFEWSGSIDIHYDVTCIGLDVVKGILTLERSEIDENEIDHELTNALSSDSTSSTSSCLDEEDYIETSFDFIIGADGLNSIIRDIGSSQDPNFNYHIIDNNEYYKILHLTNLSIVKKHMKTGILYTLSSDPFTTACLMPLKHTRRDHIDLDVIYRYNDEKNDNDIDHETLPNNIEFGYCLFQFKNQPPEINNRSEAIAFFNSIDIHLKDMISDDEISRFISRPYTPSGRYITCSKLNIGPNIVLLGDSACAYPAREVGVNVALESAMILDQILIDNNDNIFNSIEEYSNSRNPDLQALSSYYRTTGLAEYVYSAADTLLGIPTPLDIIKSDSNTSLKDAVWANKLLFPDFKVYSCEMTRVISCGINK